MSANDRPDEFALIAELFAPLAARAPGALGLKDDAALLAQQAGRELVATADMLLENVHFRPDDPPGSVARKALRVNLSDLAAMGAAPLGYLLCIAVPDDCDMAWLRAFAAGLAADQAAFGLDLLGGDTTGSRGGVCISVTALGSVAAGAALLRSGARPGDRVFVSGTVGDAAFGLDCLTDALDGLPSPDREALVARFLVPTPRLALGGALAGLATAAADVSDGLVADLGHIAESSGVAVEIRAAAAPLSPAVRRIVGGRPDLLARALTGGDDYELVFTAPEARREAVVAAAAAVGVPVAEIGAVRAGAGVTVLGSDGAPLRLDRPGWRHF